MFGCLHGDGGPDVSVEASIDEAALPEAEFEIEMTNHGGGEFTTTPTGLLAAKLVDGEPRYIRPFYVMLRDGPAVELLGGDSEVWTVEVDNDEPEFMADSGSYELSLTGLGPGTYLFGFEDELYGVDEELAVRSS